jgi:hypothetical protein
VAGNGVDGEEEGARAIGSGGGDALAYSFPDQEQGSSVSGLLAKPEVVETQGRPPGGRRDGPAAAGLLHRLLLFCLALPAVAAATQSSSDSLAAGMAATTESWACGVWMAR